MGKASLGMQSNAPDRTGLHAFTTLGAFIPIQNNMVCPGKRIFRALLDTESLFAGQTHVDAVNLGPGIFYVNSGQLGALRAGIMCGGTSQHTEPAVCTSSFFQYEHVVYSLVLR